MVSSSPVKNTATRSLRSTGSMARPTDAASPSSWLRRRVPAGQDHGAGGDVLAGAADPFARLRRVPDGDGAVVVQLRTAPASRPRRRRRGIMAPVKMRAAQPASRRWPTWPAGMRWLTRQRGGAAGAIGRAHGVAVHLRVVGRRHGDGRRLRFGQHAAVGAQRRRRSRISVTGRAASSRKSSASRTDSIGLAALACWRRRSSLQPGVGGDEGLHLRRRRRS